MPRQKNDSTTLYLLIFKTILQKRKLKRLFVTIFYSKDNVMIIMTSTKKNNNKYVYLKSVGKSLLFIKFVRIERSLNR